MMAAVADAAIAAEPAAVFAEMGPDAADAEEAEVPRWCRRAVAAELDEAVARRRIRTSLRTDATEAGG